MTILITGAAGAVGRYVVDLLARDRDVICVDRQQSVMKLSNKYSNVKSWWQDILRLTETDLFKNKITRIIHVAANLSLDQTFQDVMKNNINPTKHLSEIARHRRLVFVSSGSIYESSNEEITESNKLHPSNNYELGKIIEEQIVTSSSYYSTILRPALIYGPRCKALGAAVATIPSLLKNGTGQTIGFTGGPKTNWVHAEDVARAAVYCLDKERTENEIYNVADDTPLSFGEMISAHIEASGQDIMFKVPLPSHNVLDRLRPFIDRDSTFRALNTILAKIWTKPEIKLQLERGASSYLFQDTVFSNQKIKDAGFKLKHPDPRISLPAVIEWYKTRGWI